MENKTYISNGISITGILGVVFLVLKLCKVIAWPWIWVLAPFWIPVALGIVITIVYLVLVLITSK